MISTTPSRLRCPRPAKGRRRCEGDLELQAREEAPIAGGSDVAEVRSGVLECKSCRAKYPILAGVAIVVEDVRLFLLEHVKGISRWVSDSEIPKEYAREYREAKAEIQAEHIEEDLESNRVVALYVMNHYLHAREPGTPPWWAPLAGEGSPLIGSLIREHWDHGPFARIESWVRKLPSGDAIELGCGVGGLYPRLAGGLKSYLGVDSSFASVALGRSLALGAPSTGPVLVPEDLLQGPISREVKIPRPQAFDGKADLIVGDVAASCLRPAKWDLAIVLNALDMLDEPGDLPRLQFELLKPGGTAIQSCPYIWHEEVARKLRAKLPRGVRDSAGAAEWLYTQAGFKLGESVAHQPWLFFKHVRQLEIYSAHLFMAGKAVSPTESVVRI